MRKALALAFNLVLAVSACSSDDKTVHDAAVPDVAGQADGPQTSPDRADGKQSKDGPHDLAAADGAKADVGAMDVAYPVDTAADTSTAVDVRPLVDISVDRQALDAHDAATMLVDAGLEVALPIGFPCGDDSECCTAVDECQGIAYLYSKGPDAAPPPTISGGDTGCINCSPPGIQLRCIGGQCQGEVIPYTLYLDPLTLAHCGFLPREDGGIAMKQENPSSDGGTTVGTKTAWGCRGGRASSRSRDVAP